MHNIVESLMPDDYGGKMIQINVRQHAYDVKLQLENVLFGNTADEILYSGL